MRMLRCASIGENFSDWRRRHKPPDRLFECMNREENRRRTELQ
jgi:hypothetical protein